MASSCAAYRCRIKAGKAAGGSAHLLEAKLTGAKCRVSGGGDFAGVRGGVYWHRQASMPAQNNFDRAQMLRFATQILDTLQRRREQIGDPDIGANLERQLLEYHLRDLDDPEDGETEDS